MPTPAPRPVHARLVRPAVDALRRFARVASLHHGIGDGLVAALAAETHT